MQQGYFSVAWSDIKNSPGWFGKVCLMGLVNFIPLFGQMVCMGYCYGWARDIAWKVHQPMPAHLFGNEDGKLYSRGFFAIVIAYAAGLLAGIPTLLLGDSVFAYLVMIVLSQFLSLFAGVATMRMAIYGNIGAGFQLKKVWKMMSHDFNGLLRILGMVILIGLIVGTVFGIAFCIPIVLIAISFFASFEGAMSVGLAGTVDYASITPVVPLLIVGVLLFLVLLYAAVCASCWMTILQVRALGYWTSQFDVASWRGQKDPMPFEVADATAAAAAALAADEAAKRSQGAGGAAPVPFPTAADASSAEQPASGLAGSSVQVPEACPGSAAGASSAGQARAVCSHCGSHVAEGAKFCVLCGSRLSE